MFAFHHPKLLVEWLAFLPSPASGGGAGGEGRFTSEQLHWPEMIRDLIAANLGIEPDDFEYAPFSQHGGLGKVHQRFGDKLDAIRQEMNETPGGMTAAPNLYSAPCTRRPGSPIAATPKRPSTCHAVSVVL